MTRVDAALVPSMRMDLAGRWCQVESLDHAARQRAHRRPAGRFWRERGIGPFFSPDDRWIKVYRARDTRLGRDVALKALPREFTADPDRLARFEREARMLAALNHPNIATIHGFETFDHIHALVLEVVEGETLAERIRRPAGRQRAAGLPIAVLRLADGS